jgi:hypothetical protein
LVDAFGGTLQPWVSGDELLDFVGPLELPRGAPARNPAGQPIFLHPLDLDKVDELGPRST